MGKKFHPYCFTCTECAKPLSPNNFYEKNGKPYCEDDYHRLFSPKCAGCKLPIKDVSFQNNSIIFKFSYFFHSHDQGKIIRALGKDWHPQCFTCTECAIPLKPDNFYEKNGKPYCENDFHRLFSPKCAGCLLPITDVNHCFLQQII